MIKRQIYCELYAGDPTPRGWFWFSDRNIRVQCWHGVVLIFDAKMHKHGSTSDGFHPSYATKGSFKLGGALYMNDRVLLEARKEAYKLRNDVLPARYNNWGCSRIHMQAYISTALWMSIGHHGM